MSKRTTRHILVSIATGAIMTPSLGLAPFLHHVADAQTTTSPPTTIGPVSTTPNPITPNPVTPNPITTTTLSPGGPATTTVSPTPKLPGVSIDVNIQTGLIDKGLVIAAGAGNFVTVNVATKPGTPFIATTTTGSGYNAGELVVPNGGFVTVPIFGANKLLASTIRVWDAKTKDTVLAPDVLGTAINLRAPITSKDITKPLSDWIVEQLQVATPRSGTSAIRVFDYRTDPATVKTPDVVGNARNLVQPVTINGIEKALALWVYDVIGLPGAVSPSAATPPLVSPVTVSPVSVSPSSVSTVVTATVVPTVTLLPGGAVTPGAGTIVLPPPTAPIAPVANPSAPTGQNPQAVASAAPVLSPTPSPTPGAAQPVATNPTKTCIKTKQKKVKVGKKRVLRTVCVRYRAAA